MFFIDLMIVFGIAVILSLLFAGPFAWRRLQEPPGTFSFGLLVLGLLIAIIVRYVK